MPTERSSCLPHSFSSPELPIPSIETSTLSSTPLVTLHKSPLASPNNRPTDITSALLPVPTIRSSFLEPDPDLPDDFDPRSHNKKYGRSRSEMILPGTDCSGELIDSLNRTRANPWPKRSSFSLSLRERTPDIGIPSGQIKPEKRSRSLSPYLSKCLCYNCNVSELILRSRDLPPTERSNFDVYFARSLSHKFFNCSCYWSLQEDGFDRSSRNVSFCNTNECIKAASSLDHSGSFMSCENGQPLPVFLDRQTHVPSRSESKFDHWSLCKHQLKGHDRRSSMLSKENEKWRFEKNKSRKVSCPNLRTDTAPRVGAVRLKEENGESVGCLKIRRRWSCPSTDLQWHSSLVDMPDYSSTLYHTSSAHDNDVHDDHDIPRKYNHRSKSPRAPFSRLQPQRSFSSPDTRPSIIQPDPTCTARRHRHSISGQMSYFKLLGYNVNKKLTGSANSLFSTAVISGSSSAPNLKDMVPAHASAVAGKFYISAHLYSNYFIVFESFCIDY